MTDSERDNLIIKIASDVEVIKHDLANDFRELHGNGKPGLIEKVQNLETQFQLMRQSRSAWKTALHYVLSILSGGAIGWLTSWLTSH